MAFAWTRNRVIGAGVLSVLVIVIVAAFEPVTRKVVGVQGVCVYCHVAQEYAAEVRLSYSKHHPEKKIAEEKTEDDQLAEAEQAQCIECHLPEGFFASFFAYTHFLSLTDLFGHFRHRTAERAGVWLPPRQAAAYRVRDRLFEYNSSTCRICHIEAEIKPKRERGINAHKKALEDKMTCIECHYNEKHRSVEVRKDAFKQEKSSDA